MGKVVKKASSTATVTDAGEELILKYMQTQNRPYNANDIFANLHGQVSKASVTKALNGLVERGEIMCKVYGKQTIYVVRQDSLPLPSTEELSALDSQIESLKNENLSRRQTLNALQSQLHALNSTLTDEQLKVRIAKLQETIVNYEGRLVALRSGTRKVDPVEKAKIDRLYELYSKEWKKRKRLCMDVINALTENLPNSPSEFMEELGLELDPSEADKSKEK